MQLLVNQLVDIEPLHVATYIEVLLSRNFEKPTVKQHLAAIRKLFDWLGTGQIVAMNPAHAVRGPTHVVKSGKTPVLEPAEARTLLDSMDISTPLVAACRRRRAGRLNGDRGVSQ